MKLGPDTFRPILPFHISYKNGESIKYYGLVDSGADNTLIAAELADILGIKDVTKGKRGVTAGVEGISEVYFHPVIIKIGNYQFNVDAGFISGSNLTTIGYGLIGQIGIFDECQIRFDRKNFEFEIIPN